ncbi:MAG: pilus assembly protein PilP [Candidatus Competibacterales bacterium]|nr:pilus assembly protein PilP [Candidatus Competibacterales bacterium]
MGEKKLMNLPDVLTRRTAARRFKVGWPLLVALLGGCAEHDVTDLERYITQVRQSAPKAQLGALPEVEPYQPVPYQAASLKDPFAISAFVFDALNRQTPVVDSGGPQPDLERPREELEKYALGSLQLVGTFRDYNTDNLWALVKAPDGIVHRVREGNYVGENFGEIYDVTENRVEIREIVRDPQTGGWEERDNFLALNQ